MDGACDDETSRGENVDMAGDQQVIWLPDPYSLTEILDRFEPPVLVRVEEGYMISDEDCLASGTVMTVHGQRVMNKFYAVDQSGKDLNIPVDCRYKLRLRSYAAHSVHKTVSDVCQIQYLPQFIENRKDFKFQGRKFPASTLFRVDCVTTTGNGHGGSNHKPKGLRVSVLVDGNATQYTLPLTLRGHFQAVLHPSDRNRDYFVGELQERNLPLFVEFLPTLESHPPYSPRLGIVRLNELYESTTIYATNYIDNKRYITTFSNKLHVKLQIGKVFLQDTDNNTYSAIAEPKEDAVDDLVLQYIMSSNPYEGSYVTSLYQDIESIVDANKKLDGCGDLSHPPVPNLPSRTSQAMHTQQPGGYIEDSCSTKTDDCGKTKSASYSYPRHFPQVPFERKKQRKTRPAYETIDEKNFSPTQPNAYTPLSLQQAPSTVPQTPKHPTPPPVAPKKRVKELDNPGTGDGIRSGEDRSGRVAGGHGGNEEDVATMHSGNLNSNFSVSEVVDNGYDVIQSKTIHNGPDVMAIQTSGGDARTIHFDRSNSSGNVVGDNSMPEEKLVRKISKSQGDYMELENDPFESIQGNTKVRPRLPSPYRAEKMDSCPITDKFPVPANNKGAVPPAVPPRRSTLSNVSTSSNTSSASKVHESEDNVFDENDGENQDGVSDEFKAKTEDEVCEMLKTLKLGEFAESFKTQQVDGSLLGDLVEEDLIKDIEMSKFQARKLWLYARGWKPDAEKLARDDDNDNVDGNNYMDWTTEEVGDKLKSINLTSFAGFCVDNQVNGALLANVAKDKGVIESIRDKHNVSISRIEERKLCKFVFSGWRPSSVSSH
eukprot:gene4555-5152_t